MIPTPYYEDESVTLYVGDCREILPALGVVADCIVADQPYGETSLEWDRWPDGWLEVAAGISRSMWCFGSLRMYLEHAAEYKAAGWKLSQDIIWEKHNGSSAFKDRFKRVHEQPTHWYQGAWGLSGNYLPHRDLTKSIISKETLIVRRFHSSAIPNTFPDVVDR